MNPAWASFARNARNVSTCGVVGILSILLSGCDHERFEETTTEELRFDTGSGGAITVVEVRVDDGRVEVVAGDEGVVEVVFRNRARAADSAGARALLDNVRTEAVRDGDTVKVKARSGAGRTLGGSAWSEVTIRVPPASTELDIRIDDGRIEIQGVSGTIDAETGDGRIRVADVSGRVKLRTGDGSVSGSGLAGDFDVLTGDGRIRLDGSFGELRAVTGDGSIRVALTGRDITEISNEWTLRTSDGAIELTLPRTLAANLEASSGDGRVTNNLSRFEGSERRNRIKGALGPGGPRILVTTMDGRIVLKDS